MLRRTQFRPSTRSERPWAPEPAYSAPAELPEIKIAEKAQTVVGRHHHHVVLAREVRTVLRSAAGRASREAAAVAVKHHGLALAAASGRPDVQHQAVLAGRRLIEAVDGRGRLQRRRPQYERLAHAGPGFGRTGGLEPVRPRDRGAVGHAEEDVYAPGANAPEPPLSGLDHDWLRAGVGGAQHGGPRQGRAKAREKAAASDHRRGLGHVAPRRDSS